MKNDHSVVFHSIELERFDTVHEDKKLMALLSTGYKIESTFIANLQGKAVISLLMVREPNSNTISTFLIASAAAIIISTISNLLLT